MTRDELIAELAAIERALNERVEVWIQIVKSDGTLGERIYRGSFQRGQAPHPSRHISKKEHTT